MFRMGTIKQHLEEYNRPWLQNAIDYLQSQGYVLDSVNHEMIPGH